MKDELADEIALNVQKALQKEDPWVPYQGDAGGEGWQNTQTGEIRYQEEKPAPGEGEQEEGEEGGEQPLEAVQEGEMDVQIDPDQVSLEEGDLVAFTGPQGEVMEGEILEMADSGPVIEDANGEEYQIMWAELENPEQHIAQSEPPDGWADGWGEAPDDVHDFEEGQVVELYDRVNDEWLEGHVDRVSGSVFIEDENGRMHEVLPDAYGDFEDMPFVTAVEEIPPGDELSLDEYDDLESGETVLWEDATGEVKELEAYGRTGDGEIWLKNDYGDNITLDEEIAEGSLFTPKTDMRDFMGDSFDDILDYEGKDVKIHHPAAGYVSGELHSVQEVNGDTWAYVDDYGFNDNPEHPLGFGNTDVVQAEDHYEDWSPSLMDDLKPGDKVLYEGEVYETNDVGSSTFTAVNSDGLERVFAEDYEAAETLGKALPDEAWVPEPDVPEAPDNEEWLTGDELDDAQVNPGDTIYWEHQDSHEVSTATVDEVQGDNLITEEDSYTMGYDQIDGLAQTGEVELPEPATTERDDVSPYSYVDVAYRDDDGNVVEETALVTDVSSYGKSGTFTVETEEGSKKTSFGEQNAVAITDTEPDYDPWEDVPNDGREMDPDEIADGVIGDMDLETGGSNLKKAFWAHKHQQKDLREDFKEYFPEHHVERFYDTVNNWKSSSGAHKEGTKELEMAFKEAFDLESRVRGGSKYTSDEDYEPPDVDDAYQDMVPIAEAAKKSSERFFEANWGDEETYTRGGVNKSLRSLFYEWAENPDAESFQIDGRALNNGVPGERNSHWNSWDIRPTISKDDVMLMTDFMFNPEQNHGTEDEMWVSADHMEVAPDEVGFGSGRGWDLGGSIDEWSDEQTKEVVGELNNHYHQLTGSDGDEIYRDDFSDQQIETLARVVERAQEAGANPAGFDSVAADIRAQASQRGIDVGELGGGASFDVTDPDEWDDVPQGTEVTFEDPLYGDTVNGYFHSIYGDEAMIWDLDPEKDPDPGAVQEYEVPLDNVMDVDYETEGSDDAFFDVSDGDWSVENLKEGSEVVFEDAFGETQQGEVTEVDPGLLNVEIDNGSTTMTYDPSDIQQVEAGGLDDGSGDTVTVDGWGVSPGDIVTVEDEFVGDTMEMPVTGIDENGSPIVHYESADTETSLADNDDWSVTGVDMGAADIDNDEDGGSSGSWEDEYQQAVEAHQSAESSTDEYWDTYDAALDALPADIEDVVETPYGEMEIIDFDPQNDDETMLVASPPDYDDEMYVSPTDVQDWDPSEGSDDADPVESYDGGFSEGTNVPVSPDYGIADNSIDIGESIEVNGTEATVVDATNDGKMMAHLHEDFGLEDAGDVVTVYPQDEVEVGSDESEASDDDVNDAMNEEVNQIIDEIEGNTDSGTTEDLSDDEFAEEVLGDEAPDPDALELDTFGTYDDVDFEHPDTGEKIEATVLEPVIEYGDPLEVQDVDDSETYLIWPDGDVETV